MAIYFARFNPIEPDAALRCLVLNPSIRFSYPLPKGRSSDSIRDRGTNCGSSWCPDGSATLCEPEWEAIFKLGRVNNHEGVPLAKTEPTAVPSQDLK